MLNFHQGKLDSAIYFYRQSEQLVENTNVEKELKLRVKSDVKLAEKIKNIEAVKGLGFITIIKVLSEVNGFLLFKNRLNYLFLT